MKVLLSSIAFVMALVASTASAEVPPPISNGELIGICMQNLVLTASEMNQLHDAYPDQFPTVLFRSTETCSVLILCTYNGDPQLDTILLGMGAMTLVEVMNKMTFSEPICLDLNEE